jgi:C4-dicarboxylate-specific signal transduction histidine kinase
VQSIVITVADSGSGVASELRGKIFDPFFTTKHYGSGIGLSICHRIISDHQGTLHVSTSKWGGALFTAAFPVKKEVAS